jgi:hypothetical protein
LFIGDAPQSPRVVENRDAPDNCVKESELAASHNGVSRPSASSWRPTRAEENSPVSLTPAQARRFNEISFRVQWLRDKAGEYDKLTELQQDRDDLFDMVNDLAAQPTEVEVKS